MLKTNYNYIVELILNFRLNRMVKVLSQQIPLSKVSISFIILSITGIVTDPTKLRAEVHEILGGWTLSTRIHFVALNCCLTLNPAFKLQAIKYLEAHLDKESCTVIFAVLVIFHPFQNHARS